MDERKPRTVRCSLVQILSRILGCLILIAILICAVVYNGWHSTPDNVVVGYRFILPLKNDSEVSRIYMTSNPGENEQVTRKSNATKTIIHYTPTYLSIERLKDFSHCKVKQCRLVSTTDIETVRHADVVMFLSNGFSKFPKVSSKERSRQHWVLYTRESPGYSHNRWRKIFNNMFNATMTYKPDGYLQYPYGRTCKLSTSPSSDNQTTYGKVLSTVKEKSKGAFAYVSNCESVGYNRLKLMKELSKYIKVDIFGKCTHVIPCKRGDLDCEDRLHSKYMFYLSFENSLCKDYITEKFWTRLSSPAFVVPVAMGGLSMKDYTDVAPPDSFLHLYNFTSIKDLGLYMKKLMHKTDKYVNYHKWRDSYRIDKGFDLCRVCQLAHEEKHMDAIEDLASQWDFNSCRRYKH